MISKGCIHHIVQVKDSSCDTPSLELVLVACEFPDVFPKNLVGVPLEREIDFKIDLLLDTHLISILLYRMAPVELKELLREKMLPRGRYSRWSSHRLLRCDASVYASLGTGFALLISCPDRFRRTGSRPYLAAQIINSRFSGEDYELWDRITDEPTIPMKLVDGEPIKKNPSSGTVDIAFRKSENKYGRWLAWAINPTSTGMIGSQAFVALQRSDGPLQDDDTPGSHGMSGDNMKSFGTLDFHSGKTTDPIKPNLRSEVKIAHGIINGVSWGMMMPLGVVLARLRYLPLPQLLALWFYLHIYCQSIAYVLGIVGGGLGFYLRKQSPGGVKHTCHRYIGSALLVLATLQFLAHCLRLKKEHIHRVYWNIYHWCTGYGTILLAIGNCFKGFQLMDEGMWKRVYIAFLASLAFVAFGLEVLRWYLMRATKETSSANGDIEDKA
ncbi:putative MATE efflux family protein 9-like [Capsicum annuum]|nr:putative MATE efflux family protein 9-like [Capsicum annuum]